MRYIYQEPVITTVTDDEIDDEVAIRDLLENIKKMQYSVAMTVEDPIQREHIRSLDSVRITNITETTFDIHAFFNGASAKFKEIPFENIRKIRLVASRQAVSDKYRVSRWHNMEIAEIEGIG